eukprot:gb/GECH01013974.1/.p1 GENE.gb/GECH01013974.1/~~gb/GECH01013974.1/.p1  ORF type:complete len:177 (+),score=17.54 gb/GECH01013974.1/:1-531(+)
MRLTTEEGVTLDDTVLRELIFRILDKFVGAAAIVIKGGVSLTLMSRGLYALYQSLNSKCDQDNTKKIPLLQKVRNIILNTITRLFLWARNRYYHLRGINTSSEYSSVSNNETISILQNNDDDSNDDTQEIEQHHLNLPSMPRTIWSGGIFTLGLVMFASMFSTNTVYRYIEPNQTT